MSDELSDSEARMVDAYLRQYRLVPQEAPGVTSENPTPKPTPKPPPTDDQLVDAYVNEHFRTAVKP